MQIIEIFGKASKTSQVFNIEPKDYNENLLKWLRSKGITMASSCDGKGICRKCVIQNNWATCELTIKTFLEVSPNGKIYVDYL